MKLVSSNDAGTVEETVQRALKAYKSGSDVAAALAILTELRGVGPATAALLLAVHDPKHVIFFGDEVFYWLCSDGQQAPIKYSAKEYEALNARAREVAQRLGVKAVDVERVAFVLLREKEVGATPTAPVSGKSERPSPSPRRPSARKNAKRKDGPSASTESSTAVPPRRSKRGKHG